MPSASVVRKLCTLGDRTMARSHGLSSALADLHRGGGKLDGALERRLRPVGAVLRRQRHAVLGHDVLRMTPPVSPAAARVAAAAAAAIAADGEVRPGCSA